MGKSTADIRRPRGDEWDRILDVLRTANFDRIGGTEMPAFPLADCFVAVIDDCVIGVAGYRILDATTAKTTLLAVDPAYRRLQVGAALHGARMVHLRNQGIKTLFTNCDDDRVANWYIRRFGYRPTGKHVKKTEPFGRLEKTEWTTLVVEL